LEKNNSIGSRSGEYRGSLLEELLDAVRAAAEVIEHHVAHDAPTQGLHARS
jgi:hypothetical protein